MRLDKYLKVSRIIKRRTVANDACDAAHVTVNGRPAKASYDVKMIGKITGYVSIAAAEAIGEFWLSDWSKTSNFAPEFPVTTG